MLVHHFLERSADRLSEQTAAIDASDAVAEKVFRAYWLAVSRPSELIRRRWLRAMAARARAVGAA